METGEIVIYQAQDGQTSVDVRLEKETVWLTLNQLATLFNRDKPAISRHISNVFKESELDANSVVAKNATTGPDGKTYQVEHFNLDVIISVGYRVKSPQGTQFRIWANKVLKEIEHIIRKLKIFKVLAYPYRNRRKRFGLRVNLIAAIYNLEL